MMPDNLQPSSSRTRTTPSEYPNSDFVSRLLAATPPYLYAAPSGTSGFFFSEMLRSLVQAKQLASDQQAAILRNQSNITKSSAINHQMSRRPRKRSWTQRGVCEPETGHTILKISSKSDMIESNEKPLELTNKQLVFSLQQNYQKIDEESSKPILEEKRENSDYSNLITPSELVLPPPPSIWYPPLYPPYGIDPLHFFIDLRMPDNVYERKKRNTSPGSNPTGNSEDMEAVSSKHNESDVESIMCATPGNRKYGSAFSVPKSRRSKSPLALNLRADSMSTSTTFHLPQTNNVKETDQFAATNSIKNTHYLLPNLPTIYSNVSTNNQDNGNMVPSYLKQKNPINNYEDQSLQSDETESKSDDFELQEIESKDIDVLKDKNVQMDIPEDVLIVDRIICNNQIKY